jgi:hypothetical protein
MQTKSRKREAAARRAQTRRQQAEARAPKQAAETFVPQALKVGDWQFPAFDMPSVVFGASAKDYPAYEQIPEQFHCGRRTVFNKAFSGLFYSGGKLEDYGIRIKPEMCRGSVISAIRALMSSWSPKHEVKEATVAWALSEWCEAIPQTRGAV